MVRQNDVIAMEPSPKDIELLLEDLCTKLGFNMAARDPDRFIALAHQGPHIFADAVLLAEGLDPSDPSLEKRLRSGVHEFVAARFERWAFGLASTEVSRFATCAATAWGRQEPKASGSLAEQPA